MQFPLDLLDVSLWLAFMGVILLITSEIISPYYGKTPILIEKRRLRKIALIVGSIFIFTVLIQVYSIMIS